MEVEAKAAPKVTALVVSHNSAPALRECLRALEASNGREQLEILVVDNGSHDESPRLDSEFPGVTFLRIPRNFGKTKALNIGIRTAAGELLFFLSPQVVVQPDTVPQLVGRLDSESEAVAAVPLLIDASGALMSKIFPFPAAPSLFAAWKADASVPTRETPPEEDAVIAWTTLDALLVSKYFVKGLNYFDERYGEYLADAELCYQVRRAGKKILLLSSVRAVYRESEPPSLSDGARALLSADFLSGVATFAGKHNGFFSGAGYRLRAILASLLALLSFRDFGYQWRRFTAIVSLRKVDGSQTEVV